MANLTSYASQAASDMADADVLLGANSAGTTKTFSLANLKTFLTTASSVGTAFTGNITPNSNAAYDLGTDALEWKDLYIDGTAYLDAVDIDGGAIDGATIGANSTAPGSFTNLLAVGTVTINGSAGSQDQILLKGGSTLNYADHTVNNIKDAVATGTNVFLMGAAPTYTAGGYNTAVGMTALDSITDTSAGNYNTAVGYAAGTAVTSGQFSTYIGAYAGANNTLGNGTSIAHNTFVGYRSGFTTTIGGYNTGIGSLSLEALTEGVGNVAIGYNAVNDATTGDYNIGIGHSALAALTEGDNNVGIARGAGLAITTGLRNLAFGYNSLKTVTSGDDNIAIGTEALEDLPAATNKVIAIGTGALQKAASATCYSVAIGTSAGQYNETGIQNTFIGQNAGQGESGVAGAGNYNVYVGFDAGAVETQTTGNVGIGWGALKVEKKGGSTVGIGYLSLSSQVNTGVTTAANTALGHSSGSDVTNGTNNVLIGYKAGNTGSNDLTTGDYNTYLGVQANGSGVDAQNQIVIGYNATGHGDNIAVIGDANLTAIHPGDDNGVDLGSSSYSFKDAHVQGVSNLGSVVMTSTLEGNKIKVENVTADDTLTAAESGKTFVFNDADGATLTLPDSGGGAIIGTYFNFFIAVTITSNQHKVVCADTTNEKLIGSLHAVDADGDASAAIWNAQDGDSFSAISTNGVTKGIVGTMFTLTNMAADVWHVRGELVCTGTPATPFATS